MDAHVNKRKNLLSSRTVQLTEGAHKQCDQMSSLFFQCLAIYNNENLPYSIRYLPKWIKMLPNTKQTILKLPNSFKILPKWCYFAKSGHTAYKVPQFLNGSFLASFFLSSCQFTHYLYKTLPMSRFELRTSVV